MKKIGSTLVFLGIFAIVLNFVNMVPRVLMWIYAWGETSAWGIKIGIIVLGAILWFIGGKDEKEEEMQ
ncbi:hypothetical protein SAMN04489761_2756 [Tenacibaculum sp. MAR_2009_124]|uniref:hypothetical protein n=1 Tax=Tenacibaculum sp. MAR_2009_124 TaxID=1250059 RepID=UPI00089484F3|nr:hypothetical protein [Tenacibaculum sp. MAR_2009_124]SEC35351.1 hypothetical protein SAMN04489761_2756 [Tenacibaculum sp. MAR_2009_124]